MAADRRYRIGFLTPFATGTGGFQDMVWRSMVAAARRRGMSALVFAGGAIDLAPYNPFEKNLNIVYEIIRPEYLDGLVINNVLGAYVSPERFQEFCRGFGLPAVMVFGSLPGFPDVRVVNAASMRDVIRHMIDEHHSRHLAFIKGWQGYPDAEERFAIYRETLRECGLPYDPELVFQGQFDVDSGVQAVNHWMKTPNKEIDAIIASNDAMAFGAISTLRAFGKRVPRDLAVTGFDDTAEAAVYTPPLTTVNQPFEEVCAQALDVLRGLIDGRAGGGSVTVPARMVVRQSCGCISELVRHAETALRGSSPLQNGEKAMRLSAQAEAVTQDLIAGAAEEDKNSLPLVVANFIEDVEHRRHGVFIRELRSVFQEKIIQGHDIFSWQRYLFQLRRWIPALWSDEEAVARADVKILQACVLVGESSLQASGYQKIAGEMKSKELRAVGQELITTFNFSQLKDVIRRQLARLDVPSCYISVFRDMDNPAAGSEVFLVLTRGARGGDNGRLEQRSGQALPDRTFFPTDRRYAYAVQPLTFQDRKIGYALFELGPEDGVVYDALQVQISNSLMGSELIHQKEKNEAAQREKSDSIQELVRPMLDSMNQMTYTAKEKIGLISDLIDVTQENRDKLTRTNNAIKSMSEKIVKMADVIGIIDDISARVNILAINTSIESAHAGPFGRGFSVIAGEIRRLADSIKDNAMVIADHLKDFRPAIDVSRRAGDESQEAFRRLEKDVVNVADTLKQIASSMDNLTASSSQILTIMDAVRV